MGTKIKKMALLFMLFWTSLSYSQSLWFPGQWVSMGPNDMPNNPEFRIDAGTGPLEFVRVFQKKEGHLLVGSLHGGLFYTDNGGQTWEHTGSDHWNYTGCAWADFYPDDENTWFAYSNVDGDNGKPGKIGKKGGILRTVDGGDDWDLIGDYSDFGGQEKLKIYGTRFHPSDSKTIFVLTSEGLYYSNDCLEEYVKWKRVPNLKGWIYDVDFMDGKMYVSNFLHGNWNILEFDLDDYSTSKPLKNINPENKPMRNLTIEPKYGELLLAMDYVKGQDELRIYNLASESSSVLLKNQRINFGSGYTLAVSPHDSTTIYFGYSTRIKKWQPPYKKMVNIGRNYHVDIEGVAFDPFDSSKVFLATHGGFFMSSSSGADWESKNNGLGIAEVMGLAVHEDDPNQIAIGCFHDGSMVRADFDKSNEFYWRTVNGGDGLIPLFEPGSKNVVYTSNQYVGGGLYYSADTAKKNRNIHSLNNLKTSGWELATVLDPVEKNTVYFNYLGKNGINKGNINVCRTKDATQRKNVEILSDFNLSHQLKSYKVYGLYNSVHHPNTLIAYVLDYVKDENGNKKTIHRLFRCDKLNKSAEEIQQSWHELRHPNNYWIGDVEMDGYNGNKIYISYTKGKNSPDSIFGDRGLVYALRYSDKYRLKRQIDITKNIPNSIAGRYNMVYTKTNGGGLYLATRTGVYYGKTRVLKGKSRWQAVGTGLPHCKVYGLHYAEKQGVLTVGYFGRGVWQYYLKE